MADISDIFFFRNSERLHALFSIFHFTFRSSTEYVMQVFMVDSLFAMKLP